MDQRVIAGRASNQELTNLLRSVEKERRARSLNKDSKPGSPPMPKKSGHRSSQLMLNLLTGSSANTPREEHNASSPTLQQGPLQSRNAHNRSKSQQLYDEQKQGQGQGQGHPPPRPAGGGFGIVAQSRRAEPSLEDQWRVRDRSNSKPSAIDVKIPRLGASGSGSQLVPTMPSARDGSQASYQSGGPRKGAMRRSQRSLPAANIAADTGGSSAHEHSKPFQAAAFQFQPRTRNHKKETRESSAPATSMLSETKEPEAPVVDENVMKERESLINYTKLCKCS